MKSTEEGRLRSLTIRIPEELHRELKVKAAEQGKTMAYVVERLIKRLQHLPQGCSNLI